MARQDTKLESEGAEFLVLGNLLINRIVAYKTYTNMPGYDLVAVHPELNTSARIQVKSRWRTGAPGFIINNFDCDFVVIAKLNRGKKDGGGEIKEPEFFICPVHVIQQAKSDDWGKISFKNVEGFDEYENRWDLVKTFLESPSAV